MTRTPHGYRWIGLAAGFALSLVDFAFLLGTRDALALDDRGQALAAFGLFALTFTTLGFVVGWLIEVRIRLTSNAAVIREQLAALEHSQRQLVEYETLATIGRLASGVAHEVRNPLAVIRSAADLLRERAASEDRELRRASEFIRDEVDRLDDFVRALLEFARPLPITRRACSIVDVLERARMLAGPALRGLPIRVTLELEPGDVDAVSLDADAIAGALAALIVNAGEALADAAADEDDDDDDEGDDGESGDAAPREVTGGRVQLRARREGESIELRVVDDGPGVDPELAGRLFDHS
ncbi:MAG: hypothetical protein H6713_40305 [Myxococcales bacterium]|nr:hypothetical protein [Myxococcales bacterium]